MICGKIAFAGNPNVGKSTVFNALTGMKQHTGNWSGKTVGAAEGIFRKGEKEIKLIDLPGTYSLVTDSAEEEVTRNYLCFEEFDGVVVVCDACCLERNLIFALQVAQLVPKTVICVNMLDDARKKGIEIDIKALEEETGLKTVGISAVTGEGMSELKKTLFEISENENMGNFVPVRYPEQINAAVKELYSVIKEDFGFEGIYPALRILENEHGFVSAFEKHFKKGEKTALLKEKADKIRLSFGISERELSDKIAACMVFRAEEICLSAVKTGNRKAAVKDEKIDSVLTSKVFGIPVMILLFGFIFWITVSGANYPSELLFSFFENAGEWLEKIFVSAKIPEMLKSLLLDGVWKVLGWVVAVMLPPMAIFFPLFTILEDAGYLPRVAFNLDRGFKAASACGKQALTMWSVYCKRNLHILFRRCFDGIFRGALYAPFKR